MKIALSLVITLLCSTVAMGQAKRNISSRASKDEPELRSLVKKWHEAELKGDAATIADLLATEFSFVGGSTRLEYLEQMKLDSSLIIEANNIEDLQVQVYGDTAIVTGLNSFRIKKGGRSFAGKFYTLSAWVKRRGRWQSVKACLRPAS